MSDISVVITESVPIEVAFEETKVDVSFSVSDPISVEISESDSVEISFEEPQPITVIFEPEGSESTPAPTSTSEELSKANLLLKFNLAKTTAYSRPVFSSGILTRVDIWENSTRTEKLFEQVLSYTDGRLTSVVLTDVLSGNTYTKTLSYSNGTLFDIDEVIT